MTACYYTDDKLGRPCRHCYVPVPLALIEAGIFTHPTCGLALDGLPADRAIDRKSSDAGDELAAPQSGTRPTTDRKPSRWGTAVPYAHGALL